MWLMCGMGLCGLLAGQAVAADQKPLVYYPHDQLGALVVDASGNGHDGTPNGALVLGEGYVERCFQFNGNDTYVELARPIQDDFTLAAWIRTEAPGHEEGTSAFHGSGLFYADVGRSANDFVVAVLGTKLSFNVGNSNNSPPPDGIATYNFTVQGGVYKVSCRIIIPSGDSFWIRIPGAANLTPGENPDNPGTGWVRWSDPPDSTSWYWYDVFSGDHDQEIELSRLSAVLANELGQLIMNLGAERVMFGTGMPFNYPNPALVKLEVLEASEANKEKIRSQNAMSWLRL